MKKINRVFVVVMDSLGVGSMPDSPNYGDVDVNTLGHICEKVNGLRIPNLQKMGMANIIPLSDIPAVERPLGYYTKLNETSIGKDTMTGHWEMMGLEITVPFKTFDQNGFPEELIKALEERTGRKVIGNKSSSGTEILEELAEEEIKNAQSAIPLVQTDSRLGWEPTMDYIADETAIRWKIRQVRFMIDTELEIYKNRIKKYSK